MSSIGRPYSWFATTYGLFFGHFRSFQTNKLIFTTNECEKMSCPSSIRCWDSKPRPSDHESLPIRLVQTCVIRCVKLTKIEIFLIQCILCTVFYTARLNRPLIRLLHFAGTNPFFHRPAFRSILRQNQFKRSDIHFYLQIFWVSLTQSFLTTSTM